MLDNNFDKYVTVFKNSFTKWFVLKFSMYIRQRFPPHLQSDMQAKMRRTRCIERRKAKKNECMTQYNMTLTSKIWLSIRKMFNVYLRYYDANFAYNILVVTRHPAEQRRWFYPIQAAYFFVLVGVDAGKESLDVVRLLDAIVEVADRRNEHRRRSNWRRIDDVLGLTLTGHVRLDRITDHHLVSSR